MTERFIILASQAVYIGVFIYTSIWERDKLSPEMLGAMLLISMTGIVYHLLRKISEQLKEQEYQLDRLKDKLKDMQGINKIHLN